MPELPPTTTIKGKLLADIRAGTHDPDLLAKRHGLNGHDLVKNLDQLRKEGFVHVKWGAGDRILKAKPTDSANMAALNGHTRHPANGRLDYIDRVAEAINQLPWRSNGWRVWDRSRIIKLSGLSNDQVSHAIDSLREAGRLQQLGGGGKGIRILGVRWRGERAPESTEQPAPVESVSNGDKARSAVSQAVSDTGAFLRERATKVLPHAPELFKYMEARRIAALASADNPYIEIRFERNPLAEEAILLWETLHSARDRAEGTGAGDR